MKIKTLLVILLVLVASLVYFPLSTRAIECDGNLPSDGNELAEYKKLCEEKITQLQGEQQTLKSAISLITSKINLTQAQIKNTNDQIDQLIEEIGALGTVITNLNQELDSLSKVYVSRLRESYKTRTTDPVLLFLSSGSYANFQSQLKYLRTTQKRDQILLRELEAARINYDEEKTTKEEKQEEVEDLRATLESQQQVLGAQQTQKNQLLTETQNSEKIYQDRLAKAIAELKAIESIIAGQGSESEVRDISQGEKIATIISGASACSTGTHLHFEVVENKSHQNPANFLKTISPIWDNAPDSPFSFSGSWDWPLSEPVRITQGYGQTAYSSRYANNIHTGIDMVSGNLEVKAVRKGKLYRGSIPCGGGTLKYVHVDHAEDNYHTYYLHVNYF